MCLLSRCSPVANLLDDILLNCQHTPTVESAHGLLQVLASDPNFSKAMETPSVVREILDENGFTSLCRNSYNQGREVDGQCFVLTERLIEVSQAVSERI
jgi:hypothetical protein